ncbi:MAG: glycosyltransferase family 39 protein, partial [Paracoccaceae bacterium]|nr:glycosyltransferase family 39 protein [Paracoccaceae bacterium]
MKLAFILFGICFAGLAFVPGQTLLDMLGGGAAHAGMVKGILLFRISLIVFSIYLLALSRFPSAAEADSRSKYHDTAPRWALLLMVVILATAAGLRFYTLDRGIWYDEMLMHISHMHLSPLQILTTFKDANNHILYTFLARLSIDALGDTVTAIRLPAALFGIASIAAIYGFARRVMSWPEALAAALLLALSYHHLWFSQNARGYTALLFFSLLSSSFLIDAMRTGSTKRWVAYAVAGALGAFTHLTIAFLFIGHFLFFLYRAATRRGDRTFPLWPGIFQGFGILTLLTLVLHAIVLPDILGGALLG